MSQERTHLFDDYYFREATPQEFGPFFLANRPEVFTDSLNIIVEDWMSDDEKAKLNQLGASIRERFFHRIFILKNEKIIGWHMGRQIEAESYYMSNTGLFKEYQGKGIYRLCYQNCSIYTAKKAFKK